jgi:hypothetical protein
MSKPNETPLSLASPSSVSVANDALKAQARDLYLSRRPKGEISRALGVSPRTVSKWAREEGWELEREDADKSLIDDNFAARKITVATIARLSADQVLRAVQHINDRPDPPSLMEAEKLAILLGALDKIGRLDSGKATDNVALQGAVKLTLDQVRAAINSDPFEAVKVPE